MKNKSIILLIILLCSALIFSAGISALADMGDYNDYGGGTGGSDDWGTDDWGTDDWDSGGSYGGGGFYFSGGTGVVPFIIFAVIIFAVVMSRKKRGAVSTGGVQVQVDDNAAIIVDAISQKDPRFSKDVFIQQSRETFITLQKAWMNKDLEKMRSLETDELYRVHEQQVKEYISLKRTNILERININEAYLSKYERDSEFEYLTVYMNVRMVDYITDDNTGSVIRGVKDKDCFMRYLVTFVRDAGAISAGAAEGSEEEKCPRCSAPINLNGKGKCEYCGYVISGNINDWLTSAVVAIKPGTPIDNRGVIIH